MTGAVGLTVQEVCFDLKTVQLSLGQGWIPSCHFTERREHRVEEKALVLQTFLPSPHLSLLPALLLAELHFLPLAQAPAP